MVDNRMSLTFSVRNNPGRYALLLGSGASTEAGMPTGWQIVKDLVRQVAAADGEEIDNEENPVDWYEEEYGKQASYEGIIGDLTNSQTERQGLLEDYFEPSDAEAERDEKTPTDAHRSIAWLVENGYIDVILTTNFDQLLEEALRNRGVNPVVISGEETARGAEPLCHQDAVIIKVNGDYKETNIKNLASELEEYSEPMQQRIERVFNDYGLIVCGWSGKYDTRLRESLQAAETHRYPTYWTYYSELGDVAETLVENRDGISIQNNGATKFFSDLKDRVQALEGAASGEPLSTEIARERVKRYLPREEHQIDLADLIDETAQEASEQLHDQDRFPLHLDDDDGGSAKDLETERYEEYGNIVRMLLAETMTCGYWSGDTTNSGKESVLKAVSKVAPTSSPDGVRNPHLNKLRRYPATLVLYGSGLAAQASGNWELVNDLLSGTIRVHQRASILEKRPVEVLHPQMVLSEYSSRMSREDAEKTLRRAMKEMLEEQGMELFTSSTEYEHAFEEFEILFDMLWYENTDEKFRSMIGTTYWGDGIERLKEEVSEQKDEWPPVRDDVLNSNGPHAVKVLEGLEDLIA